MTTQLTTDPQVTSMSGSDFDPLLGALCELEAPAPPARVHDNGDEEPKK